MKMTETVEIESLDLRYEGHRLRNRKQEGLLLSSIAQRGIEKALEGVDIKTDRVLLNGFKRYRCARKLNIRTIPYKSLGQDEITAITAILRVTRKNDLHILEQARFIEQLKLLETLSVSDIAEMLSRSKGWVSMRTGLMADMSDTVREKLFSGSFPVYSYMYTLRQFMRMNSVSRKQIDEFVVALSGKKLSSRDIEMLAHGYFRGPDSFREHVKSGNITLLLEHINQIPEETDGCNGFEQGLLKDLELSGRYMQKVTGKSQDPRLKNRSFYAQAHLLTAGILSCSNAFIESMRQLHDRSGQA